LFVCPSDHLNVELDPVSQIEKSEAIAALSQQTVGWYHSHPIFRNDPSVIDVQNQMNYQSLFHGDAGAGASHAHGSGCAPGALALRAVDGMVPFVAAIITVRACAGLDLGRDWSEPAMTVSYFCFS
jgi:hypothetical protein